MKCVEGRKEANKQTIYENATKVKNFNDVYLFENLWVFVFISTAN